MKVRASNLVGWRRLLLSWLLLAMVWQPVLLALSQAHGFEGGPAHSDAQTEVEPSIAVDASHAHEHAGHDDESSWQQFLHVLHCCAPGAVLLQERTWPLALRSPSAPALMDVGILLPGWQSELLRPPIG